MSLLFPFWIAMTLMSLPFQATTAALNSIPAEQGVSQSQPPVTARYVFPVQPSGVATYGRWHHDYPAADIFCPVGSNFVAPTSGTVDFVSYTDTWSPKTDNPAVRGGLSVAIIGDDGIRYYGSHLSAIAKGITPGVYVHAGDLLGTTGKTGDARFTAAHLHFGISHPTTPTDWKTRRGEVWPYVYLRAWEKHLAMKPKV